MLISDLITSRLNLKIKHLLQLQKNQVRASEKLFVIEGLKEIEKAVSAGYFFHSVFFCTKLISPLHLAELLHSEMDYPVYEVSHEVYEKIAYRENSGGVVVVAQSKTYSPEKISLASNPLYLVIEGIEKPGNLGAIYRTADAAGIDAVFICDPKTDIYNPNAIRASLGCIFTVPTVVMDTNAAISWLKKHRIQILSTYLQAAIPYHTANFKIPTAIVMGTEATGITQDWVDASDANIIIPMRGQADSMNVSVSTAIVVFEAMRQRGF
jgi:TrmH family RNA methyltransferase